MSDHRYQVYLTAFHHSLKRFALAEGQNAAVDQLSILFSNLLEDGRIATIFSRADQLASLQSSERQVNLQGRLDQPLRPLLEVISREASGDARRYGYSGLPVQLTEDYFPQKLDASSSAPDYAALWSQFLAAAQALNTDALRHYANNLLGLLERYASQVSAHPQEQSDVSLYDYTKTCAALALCLYDHQQAEQPLAGGPFLLVGGDISGIQAFIYDIISKHAAKNLKGRSFYLQMLVDSVIRRILNDLELPLGHVVYASGGGFFLLTPHTQTVLDRLRQVKTDLDAYLFDKHKTALYLALGHQPLEEKDLHGQALSQAWRALLDQLNQQKRRRYAAQLVDRYDAFFEPDEVGGLRDRDAISGEEIPVGEGTKPVTHRDGTTGKILSDTFAQVELGKKLKQADYWVMVDRPHKASSDSRRQVMAIAGVEHYLVPTNQAKQLANDLVRTGGDVFARRINHSSFAQPSLRGLVGSFGFTFYGGNEYPSDAAGFPRDFSELAGVSDDVNEENGFTRLGVLRMDVDGLGQIFINGMEQRSLARYSTLSRSLDYFFKGYLNTIWQADEELKHYTQILYSGGDDLFIVGKWTECVKFAERIQAEFAKYCCHNPHLSLSGGLAIVPPKFPISIAAGMAAEAEKTAKTHQFSLGKDTVQEKNSFCLLGIPLNWTYEYSAVKHLKDQLVQWLEAQHVSRSLLGRIKTHYQAYVEQTTHHRNEAWRWHMAYDFSRYGKGIRDQAVREALGQIKIAAFTDSYQNWRRGEGQSDNHPFLTLLYLAARWAELEIRTF